MELSLLDTTHPHVKKCKESWRQCTALYAGGSEFADLLPFFLPKNPQEPGDVYEQRKNEASYISYLTPIVDFFVAWLFSAGDPVVRGKDHSSAEPVSTDVFYTEFQADIGGDQSLNEFMRGRATEALKKRAAYWLIELPYMDDGDFFRAQDGSMPLGEYVEKGYDKARLLAVDAENLLDWECDETGKLVWCNIHTVSQIRGGVKNPRTMTKETWKIYDREKVEIYEVEYENGKRPNSKTEIPRTGNYFHRFLEVPVVSLDVGDGLWVGERVRQAQIEHFRLTVAKNWLIRRTCYAMPILNLDDGGSRPQVMGAGHYMMLGKDDKFSWSAPPNAPFDVIQKAIDSQRDEIFRVVHQMAQGLDNNAETVGRSADSKQIDTASTRIMLNAYGIQVRKAIEETLEILSDARGDTDITWSVEGFNGYDTATAGEILRNVTDAMLLSIPSKTLRAELMIKAGLALAPEMDSSQKEMVRQEIRTSVNAMGDLESLQYPGEVEIKRQVQELKEQAQLKIEKMKSATAEKVAKSAPKPMPGQPAQPPAAPRAPRG